MCCGVLCLCSVFAFAQKDKKGKTTPAATIALPEVIDFNTVKSLGAPAADTPQGKGSSSKTSSSGNNLDYKTAISIAPFNILQGFADIGFEVGGRNFGKNFFDLWILFSGKLCLLPLC